MNPHWKAEARTTELEDQPEVWQREKINVGHEKVQPKPDL